MLGSSVNRCLEIGVLCMEVAELSQARAENIKTGSADSGYAAGEARAAGLFPSGCCSLS